MKTGRCSTTSPSDSSKKITLEPIPIAGVSAFHGLANEGSTETWRANLIGSTQHAWVKLDTDHRQIIADLICAQVGRALSLPIPKPFLVLIEPEDLPEKSSWFGKLTSPAYCFASQNAAQNSGSFARHLTNGAQETLKAIQKWSGLNATMIFDEWIANDDRNNGNILYSPDNDSFWLIDHGRALTGTYWPLWGLEDAALKVPNLLADATAKTGINLRDAIDIETEARERMHCARRLAWDQLDMDNHIKMLDPQVSIDSIRTFLIDRVLHTTKLLMDRLGYHHQIEFTHEHNSRPLDAGIH